MKPLDPSILTADPLLHRVWGHMGRPANCRVVGGYVRDRLLGRPNNDLDLAIDGDVNEASGPARRLGKALRVHPHLLGTAPHRIWRIETDHLKIEIWPLGDLIHQEDMKRRDFSCNALSWELPDGPLVDLVGGFEDIQHRRLRAISRFNLEDDPVRLLRAPRFLAQLVDFELDDRTRSWIEDLAPSLQGAPRERVGQELLTLLRAPAAARGLRECLGLGLFEHAAPKDSRIESEWLSIHCSAADSLNSLRNAGETPAPHLSQPQCGAGVPPARGRSGDTLDTARLALLFRAWGLPSERAAAPYAWTKPVRENARRAAQMLDEAFATVDGSAADRRELAWLAGPAYPALIALAAAVESDRSWDRWLRQWRRDPAAFLDPQPLLSGLEISEITGIEPGPELGTVARALLRAQVRGEIRSRGGAVRWLARRTASH